MNKGSGMNGLISAKVANMSFVCALLVVLIHTTVRADSASSLWWFKSVGREFVCKIGVPFFFVASGYYLAAHWQDARWYGREIRKRVRTLLVPFVCLAMLWFVYLWFLQIVPQMINGGDVCLWQYFNVRCVVKATGVNIFDLPQLGPLWYLRCLFLLVSISPIFFWLYSRGKWACVWYLSVIYIAGGAIIALGIRPNSFWLYGLSVEGLFYFPAGIFIRLYGLEQIRFHALTVSVCGFCSSLLLCLFLMKLVYCPYRDCFVFVWLAIPLLLIIVWNYVPTKKWPAWLISCTFPIYLLHKFLIVVIDILCNKFMPHSYATSMLLHIFIFVVVIGGAIALTHGLRKFLPRISGSMFGGR